MTIDIIGMEQNGKTIFDQREDVTFVLGEGADMNIPMGLELALEKIKKNEKVQILIRFKLYFGFYYFQKLMNHFFKHTVSTNFIGSCYTIFGLWIWSLWLSTIWDSWCNGWKCRK